MRLMRRPLWPLAGMLFALFGFWLQAGPVYAQSSGGAMDLFQGLTSDEQQAVLSKLGAGNLGGGTSTLNDLPGQLGSTGSLNQAQQQEYQQEMAVRRQRAAEEQQPLIPILKGGDWVIVQIGFQLPPAVSNQQAQALQRLYSQQGGTAPSAQSLQALQALQGGTSGSSGSSLAQAAATGATGSPELTSEEKKKLQPLIDLIRSRNPYQLTPDGVLVLPGFAPIPLLGLTEQQATLRLQIVPDLLNLQVRLTLLPLKKTGQQALKPFGYGLFAEAPSSFEPLTNVPVPSNYVIGPGDNLDVLLYGNQNHAYQMVVARDGQINFPELGPMKVAGQLFTTVAAEIESRVAHQMIGVRASVSMAQTRSIQVFVMGEAFAPGAYTISGLGTITSALYAAGGVRNNGSLRNIQLKRGGALVATLDLYDLLLHGNTTDDAKLLQGDVVFIPSVGPTVAIEGQVRRPAIYESKSETSPEQMVAMAGGLSPNADVSKATLTRITPNGERVVLPLGLAAGDQSQGVRNGDLINIPRLRPTLESAVELQGHVFNPGSYFYRPGMRISDVIRSVDDVQPNSDLHYVLIRRELPPDLHVVAVSADLAAALAAPGSSADVPLMPRDQITVFDLSSSRERIIQPVLEDLKTESTAAEPEQVVSIEGRVNVPGQYPLEPGMRVADLVRSGGGLSAAAYTGQAELTRYVVAPSGTRQTQIIDVDLTAALSGNPTANVTLQPYDVLSIKEVSQWTTQDTITLRGEVRFPGTYTIKPGETLKSVMERAGGFTPYAFPQGAVFTRVELREREQQEMDDLAERMRVELGVLALRAVASSSGSGGGGDASNALIVGRSLLQQLQGEKAVGRLVINLSQIVRQETNSRYDVILRDGDELIVPKFEQEVTVIGEVQDPTSHLYNPDLTREDYIRLSGGLTSQADGKRVYVVRADGSVVASGGSRWFNGGDNTEMRPGDTIVVPINAEQMLPLPFWQAVTTILYNVAIAVAAVHAL